jgi:serine/threonine-protein kinase
MLHIDNCLSVQDLNYIQSLPDVLLAKEKLAHFTDHGAVYFKIILTDSLKSALSTRLDLDLSNIMEIPMRWIKGDTMPHTDKGKSEFTNTYLVYLTDSSGEFVLGDTAFPIQENTAFIFNEGILHETMNTGLMPRLLLGPMNEFAEPVGLLTAIYYYSTQLEAETASVTDDPSTLSANSLAVSSSYIVGRQNAMFLVPMAVAVDASGNVFVGDVGNNRIRKVTPNGIVTTIAGSGDAAFADAPLGPGANASFNGPAGVVVDSSGNIFVADGENHRIRKVTPNGIVTTIAGSGNPAFADAPSGPATYASFLAPEAMAIDASGNIFLVDRANHRIRKISPSGAVTTIAGSGTGSGSAVGAFADGTGSAASFSSPMGVAIDASGNLFVTDQVNNRIRKLRPPTGLTWDSPGANIDVNGDGGAIVTTIAGSGTGGFADETGAAALFDGLRGVAVDTSGNVYITDQGNHRIRKLRPPTGLTWDSPGAVIDESGNGGAIVTTIAGSASYGFADAPLGPGSAARFFGPNALAVDNRGNLFVSEEVNNRIRKIVLSTGAVTTLAGGDAGYKDNTISLPSRFWKIAYSSTGTSPKVFIWNNGYMLNQSNSYFLYPAPPGSVCFLEGTTVLCFSEGKEQYVPVEKLRKGTLVKTLRDGYKRVELIAKEEMVNPGTDERIEQRLYKCSTSRYPELTSDLYITGCHSILVNTITDDEKAKLIKHLDRVFVTDRKYRLIACVDERAEPWNSEGTYTIWHFALENEDIKMNYGVFVNGGLLVESCSKHVLKNKSDMVLV